MICEKRSTCKRWASLIWVSFSPVMDGRLFVCLTDGGSLLGESRFTASRRGRSLRNERKEVGSSYAEGHGAQPERRVQ